MYNIKRRKYLSFPTVGDLVKALKEFPDDAGLSVCGGAGVYLHVDEDDENNISSITLDYSPLDEEYE